MVIQSASAIDIKHVTFTPLVLSTTGGMGHVAEILYNWLASILAEKRDFPLCYDTELDMMPIKLCIAQSLIMSIM